MIRTDQNRRSGRNAVHAIVPEDKRSAALDHALVAQNRKVNIEGDLSQRNHHLHARQQHEFPLEVTAACANLLRCGLVSGWRAAHGRCDVGIGQPQPVISRKAFGLRRETGEVEHAIEGGAGTVAGKRASRAVRAMRSRRKPHNQHARIGIAE
jgi:hypothetical protein